MKAIIVIATTIALGVAGAPPVRADICGEYRFAIDGYVAASVKSGALDDTVDAAHKGIRGARAIRSSLASLRAEAVREILTETGPGVDDRLEAAETASAATIEAFEAIYRLVRSTADERGSEIAVELDAARIAADAAAAPALDSLSVLEGVPRRGALKAASASVSASPGKATSTALVSIHESIFRAACE